MQPSDPKIALLGENCAPLALDLTGGQPVDAVAPGAVVPDVLVAG
jgi:hypothetical protein